MRIIVFFFIGISFFWFACNNQQAPEKKSVTIDWSNSVDSLLRDTTFISPYHDSIKNLLLNAPTDTTAIDLLNQFSSINKGKAFYLMAKEAETKSISKKYEYGRLDAMYRLSLFYLRNGQGKVSDSIIRIVKVESEKAGYKKIISLSLLSLGDLARVKRDYDEADDYYRKTLIICNETHDKNLRAIALSGLGDNAQSQNKYPSAIQYFRDALFLGKEINDKNILARNFRSLGDVYRLQNNSPLALENYQLSYSYAKALNDKVRMAQCIGTIGELYLDEQNYTKAQDNFRTALSISRQLNNTTLEAQCLAAVGKVKSTLLDYDSSNYYYEKAIEIANANKNNKTAEVNVRSKNTNTLAVVTANMGENYFNLGNYTMATQCYNEAIELSLQLKNKNELSFCYKGLGEIALKQNQIELAKSNGELALQYANETGVPQNLETTSEFMNRVYEHLNNPAEQLKMFQLFVRMKDSLNTQKAVRKFAEIEYSAKESELKLQSAEKEKTFKAVEARKEDEIKHQRFLTNIFIGGFVLLGMLSFLIFRTLQQNKKAKKIIELQKVEVERQRDIVEEKQKEILDSFTYSKRLQDAILPPSNLVKQVFPESFILYKPKDIVAGDFYWMENVNGLILFAAADCTGHGVPGALVSIVCSNALNRTVKEFGISDPGKILGKVRELVVETFQKSESEVMDGMDISLASINRETGAVLWSGANNPLWYAVDGKINEITANKQPIGKVENPLPFTTHQLQLKKGDSLFLFTDGYADQFGGPKGKKFKYQQLKEIIETNISMNADQFKITIDSVFENWKGNLEQVDDVCMIGIKL